MKFFLKHFKTAIASLLIASLFQVTYVQAQEQTVLPTTETTIQVTNAPATIPVSAEPFEFSVKGQVFEAGDIVKVVFKPLQEGLKDVSITFPQELSFVNSTYTESPNKKVVEQSPVEEKTVPSEPVVPTEPTTPVVPTEPTTPVVPTEPTTPTVPTEPAAPVVPTPTPEGDSEVTEVITPEVMPLGQPEIYAQLVDNKIVVADSSNEIGASLEMEFVADSVAHGDIVITGTNANGETVTKTASLEAYLPEEIDLIAYTADDLKTKVETAKKSELKIVVANDITLTKAIYLKKSNTLDRLTLIPKGNITITSGSDTNLPMQYGKNRHFSTVDSGSVNANNKRDFYLDLNGITLKGSGADYSGGIDFQTAGSLHLKNTTIIDSRNNIGAIALRSDYFGETYSYKLENVNIYNHTAVTSGKLMGAIETDLANLELVNCNIQENACYGVSVGNSPSYSRNNLTLKVSDSDISNNGSHGIFIDEYTTTKISKALISNSTISNNGHRGLYIPSDNSEITNSVINSNKGGGVFFKGTQIDITNSEISLNDFSNKSYVKYNNSNGGGVYVDSGVTNLNGVNLNKNNSDGNGGALSSKGLVNVISGEILENTAAYQGGGIYSTNSADITGTKFGNNISNKDGGGAIYSDGTVTVIDGEFTGNKANHPDAVQNGHGGAIRAYEVNITGNSKFEGNSAKYSGGAIYTKSNATITGKNVLFNNNKAEMSGGAIAGYIGNKGKLTITDATVSNNTAVVFGGGISFQLVVADNVKILNNKAIGDSAVTNGNGGGIGSDDLTMTNSLVKGNVAEFSGGGINTTTANISTSQILDNVAKVEITNKSSDVSKGGGGIRFSIGKISSTTIANNLAHADGGGIYINKVNLPKVIIAKDVIFENNFSNNGYSYWTVDGSATTGDSSLYKKQVFAEKFSLFKPVATENAVEFENAWNNYDISFVGSGIKYQTTVKYVDKNNINTILKQFAITTVMEEGNPNVTLPIIPLTGILGGFVSGGETWKPIVEDITPAVTLDGDNIYVATTVKNQTITIPCGTEEFLKVTFDPRNGEETFDTLVEKDTVAVKPVLDPQRTDGAIFVGWYLKTAANANPWKFDTAIDKDGIELEARYKYTVRFDSDGAQTTPADQVLFEADKAVKPIVNPIKVGFDFVGWYNGDIEFDFGQEIKGNVELKARWIEKEYTVTFMSENVEVAKIEKVKYGATIKSQVATKSGYRFDDWYKTADFTGEPWNFATEEVVSDMTLYARFIQLSGPSASDDTFARTYTIGTTVEGNRISETVRATGANLNGYELVGNTTNGTLNFNTSTGTFEYTLTQAPTVAGTTIEDSFSFRATDTNGLKSNTATINLSYNVVAGTVTPETPVNPVTPVTPVTPGTEETQTIEQQIIPQGTPVPVTQNGRNFTAQPIQVRNTVGVNEFLISNEDGTPLGTVTVPKDKTIDDINIEDEIVPLGVKANPKTGDTNYILYIAITLTSLITLVYIQRKTKKV